MALAFPPIYLLPTHISLESLHELEDQIPTLTYDITEATVVLGKVTTKQRAQFELRNRDLWTAEVVRDNVAPRSERADGENLQRKRRKVDGGRSKDLIVVDSSTESEDGTAVEINRRYESMRETPESTQSQDSSSSPAAVVSSQLVPNSGSSVALQRQDDIEPQNTVKVVKLAWFTDSVAAGRLYPIECYLVYEGKRVSRPEVTDPEIKKASFG
ncbi:MAG: hypothetical protein M1818_007164 [Claussenomyces sp. TS43310]|nr:MAG: hypothetical protein M1818_007164 [Claussenomyces sp. TS43310]